MELDLKTGWLKNVAHKPSPFFNERPAESDISLGVVHSISLPLGEFGGPYIDQLFAGTLEVDAHDSFKPLEGLEVAAHVLINRMGNLTQYVSFNDRAWHAGRSSFQGRDECNDYSIGIELEGSEYEQFTPAQYDQLSDLLRLLMDEYPLITIDRIVGHSDVAPNRKTDPGPYFDWALLHNRLK